MQVYKFLPAEFALEDLRKRRLKISTFEDMNDPFELQGLVLSNPDVQRVLKSHFLRSYGALCFSRNCSNPVLWSHYGDKHKGICLGFNISAAVEVHDPLYVEDRSVLDPGILLDAAGQGEGLEESDPEFQASQKVIQTMLLTKFKAWNYEDEVRIFVRLSKNQTGGDLYFYDFDENIRPNLVIAGPRRSVAKSDIEAAVSAYSPQIIVVQAMLSPNSFEVVEETQAPTPTTGASADLCL